MWRELLIGRERALLALDQLEMLLPGLTSDGVPAVVDARWSFARHMLAQLDRQDEYVLLPLKGDARPAVAEILSSFSEDRAKLATGFQEHARRYWRDESIAADPAGYGRSLAPMLKAARGLLLAEKERLHPLLQEMPSAARVPLTSPSRKWASEAGRYRSTAPASPAPRATRR
jgi:hypothetical protein